MTNPAEGPLLAGIVTKAARRYGDRAAFRLTANAGSSTAGELSYRELDRATDEAAVGLAARGIGADSVLLLSLPSGTDYAVAYLAAAKVGATTAGANPRLQARERALLVDTVGPDLVLATGSLSAGIPADQRVEVVEPCDDPGRPLLALRNSGDVAPIASADPDRPTCICFTSGSTGDPRGVWFTDRQLAAIHDLDTGGVWGSGGHMVSGTAFAHVGVMTKIGWQLASGATIHVMDRWTAAGLLDLIERYRLPVVNGVAAQIALLMQEPGFERRDLSCIQSIVVGAGPSPPALVTEARARFGAPYVIRYSSTESGGIGLSTGLGADDDEALHTVGRPRPGVAAEVRGPEGQTLATGEIGELWLRTPSAMSGYWNDPGGTAESLVNGWLRTGDLARVDDAGCFRLSGRVKELYIRGGYNVYPMEVEAVLSTHPGVAQIAVVPRPDPTMGEIGVAVVVPTRPDRPPTLDDLSAHGRNALSAYKLPEAIRIVDRLPLNAGEKLDRRFLAGRESNWETDR